MMYKVETVYDGILDQWTTTVKDDAGKLYSIASDDKKRYAVQKCIHCFVERIVSPSKSQRPFDWSEWPDEYMIDLLADLTSDLTITKTRASRLSDIVNSHPNLKDAKQ